MTVNKRIPGKSGIEITEIGLDLRAALNSQDIAFIYQIVEPRGGRKIWPT